MRIMKLEECMRPSQLSVDEDEMMNRFFSEEIPTYLVEENINGDEDSDNKDKNKILIWDISTDNNETAIDTDIWNLLGYS
ncbi:hypothetical protein LIER_09199 [Lithospermum erythrorhizon]|uniref:Uncharacterized protein n=1 Tax=Lithospermum erythrorhizon TaxID=34254 RepID=A0AAV3PGR8_LITER